MRLFQDYNKILSQEYLKVYVLYVVNVSCLAERMICQFSTRGKKQTPFWPALGASELCLTCRVSRVRHSCSSLALNLRMPQGRPLRKTLTSKSVNKVFLVSSEVVYRSQQNFTLVASLYPNEALRSLPTSFNFAANHPFYYTPRPATGTHSQHSAISGQAASNVPLDDLHCIIGSVQLFQRRLSYEKHASTPPVFQLPYLFIPEVRNYGIEKSSLVE